MCSVQEDGLDGTVSIVIVAGDVRLTIANVEMAHLLVM